MVLHTIGVYVFNSHQVFGNACTMLFYELNGFSLSIETTSQFFSLSISDNCQFMFLKELTFLIVCPIVNTINSVKLIENVGWKNS